jgi:predicted nucleotidyltransferase
VAPLYGSNSLLGGYLAGLEFLIVTKKVGGKTKSRGRSIPTEKLGRSTTAFGRAGSDIAVLFAGRPLIALLRLFLLNPARDYYQRELVDSTGERLFQVQRTLKRLEIADVVTRSMRGNRTYYRANRAHPAFEELKSLLLKTVGLGDALRAEIRRLGEKVQVAFIFGSVARGDETRGSDVDVMIIGDIPSRTVASAFLPVKRLLRREFNVAVYSPTELRKRFRANHPFAREVIKGPKIFLLGDDHVLGEIIQRRPA